MKKNIYTGDCAICGAYVPAKTGIYDRKRIFCWSCAHPEKSPNQFPLDAEALLSGVGAVSPPRVMLKTRNAMAGVFLRENHENNVCFVCGASACILIRPSGWYTIRENVPGTWYCWKCNPQPLAVDVAKDLLSGLDA